MRQSLVKLLAVGFATAILSAPCAHALDTTTYQPKPAPTASHQPQEPDEAQLQEHGHYRNVNGNSVHSPAHSRTGGPPAGASAKCGDGTYSFSQNHRGTCSHHGGVVSWL